MNWEAVFVRRHGNLVQSKGVCRLCGMPFGTVLRKTFSECNRVLQEWHSEHILYKTSYKVRSCPAVHGVIDITSSL